MFDREIVEVNSYDMETLTDMELVDEYICKYCEYDATCCTCSATCKGPDCMFCIEHSYVVFERENCMRLEFMRHVFTDGETER